MSGTGKEISIEYATAIADRVVEILRPSSKQIAVVGSVRRGEHRVSDIEILLEPIFAEQRDLFGSFAYRDNLAEDVIRSRILSRSGNEIIAWGPKLKRIMLANGVALEICMVLDPFQWGVAKVIKTGPAQFSRWVVTQSSNGGALPNGMYVEDLLLHISSGAVVPTPTEKEFFRAIGLAYTEPGARRPIWQRSTSANLRR